MNSYSKKKGKRSRRRSSRRRKQRGGQKATNSSLVSNIAEKPVYSKKPANSAKPVYSEKPANSPILSNDAYIPYGIEIWLTKNKDVSFMNETMKNSHVFLKGALRFLKNAFPDRPQTNGHLLEPTGIKMHAAIVSWLQEQMTIVPESHRSNLKAAYTYIKNAYPEEDTTDSILEAAKNQLKFEQVASYSGVSSAEEAPPVQPVAIPKQ
jgi:hypothetical protein